LNLKAYELRDTLRLHPIGAVELSPESINDAKARWIDITSPTKDELEAFFVAFNLHRVILDSCQVPQERPRVLFIDEVLFMAFPVPHGEKSAWLSIVCLPGTLITIDWEQVAGMDELAVNLKLIAPDISSLLYQVLEHLAEYTIPVYLDLRRRARNIALRLEEESYKVEVKDIQDLKSAASRLGDVVEDQHICLTVPQFAKANLLGGEHVGGYFNNLRAIYDNSQRGVERLEKRISGLQQHHASIIQDATNKRLKILSILSAVYLPATLIAGIYGMNFDYMPILGMRFGYYLVLCIMAAIVGAQFFIFYRRGWFK